METKINTTEPPVWLVTDEKVKRMIQKIIEVANPVKIILFGSYVRGKITTDSDIDILVVVDNSVKVMRKESARIRGELRSISMYMDILVLTEEKFETLKDSPGLVYKEILETGKVVYERGA